MQPPTCLSLPLSTFLTGLLLSSIISGTLNGQSLDQLDIDNGVNGSRFGTLRSEYTQLEQTNRSKDGRYLATKPRLQKIEGLEHVEPKSIHYFFFDDVLRRVLITLETSEDADTVREWLNSKYGKARMAGTSKVRGVVRTRYEWKAARVEIQMSRDKSGGTSLLWFISTPYEQVVNAWKDSLPETARHERAWR